MDFKRNGILLTPEGIDGCHIQITGSEEKGGTIASCSERVCVCDHKYIFRDINIG